MGTWVAWICVPPGSELPTWLPKGIRPKRQSSRLLIHSLNNINEKALRIHLCSSCLSFLFKYRTPACTMNKSRVLPVTLGQWPFSSEKHTRCERHSEDQVMEPSVCPVSKCPSWREAGTYLAWCRLCQGAQAPAEDCEADVSGWLSETLVACQE